jgi:hypothetical protein
MHGRVLYRRTRPIGRLDADSVNPPNLIIFLPVDGEGPPVTEGPVGPPALCR